MTQRFRNPLTNFVVILTTLFLLLGPVLAPLTQAQFIGTATTEETEAILNNTDTTSGDDLLFSQPVGGTTGPSDASTQYFNEANRAQGPGAMDVLNAAQERNFTTVYNFFVMAGGWVASLGGMVFDFAFSRFVLEFGCWFVSDAAQQVECNHGAGQVGGAVNQLWTVVRDLFNLIFIFSLVFIGLRLILNADETTTRKTIGLLIAAALLVNFSLYIGKLVIDISNFTAVQIHDAMVGGFTYQNNGYQITADIVNDGTTTENVTLIGSSGQESISGAFMQVLYISTFFSQNSLAKDGVGSMLIGFIAFIFLCYLGFILAYGGIMVISRFIALIFLLIFSPMMFLGWVLPQFKTYSDKWRTSFLSYCFFIPAYVFLLYASLFVLIQLSESLKTDAGGYGAVIAGNTTGDGWTIFLLYFLGVGFLYASTKVAGAMSKSGAQVSLQGVGKVAGRAAGAATFGVGGWAGRKTFGQLGYRLSESDRLRDSAAQGGISGFAARRALGAARIAGSATYDVRGIKTVQKQLGAGEAKKGGYAGSLKASAKASAAYAKGLGSSDTEITNVKERYKSLIDEAEVNIRDIQNKFDNNENVKASRSQLKVLQNRLNAPGVSETQKQALAQQIIAQQNIIDTIQKESGLAEAQTELTKLKNKQDAEIKQAKSRRARTYADMLESSAFTFGDDLVQFHHQNQNDASAIRKELGKDKNDELLEKLGKLEEQADKSS